METTTTLTPAEAYQKQINAKLAEDVKSAVDQSNPGSALAGVEPEAEQFPDSLAECFKLLHQRQAELDSNAEVKENKTRRAVALHRLDAIRKRCFEMQQGPRPIAVDLNAVQAANQKRAATGEYNRECRISNLRFARELVVQNPNRFLRPSHCEADPVTLAPHDLLLSKPLFRQLLTDAAVAKIELELAELEAFPVTNIAARIEELKAALVDANNGDATQIQNELARLRSPEASDIATRRKRTLQPLRDAYVTAFEALRAESIKDMRVCVEDAKQAETFFFANFNLPRTPTPVSGRYEQAVRELEGITAGKDSLRWWIGNEDLASVKLWALYDNQ